jgi:hypothetical protein
VGTAARVVHLPSAPIAASDADRDVGLLGDKAHSTVFGDTKIERAAPAYQVAVPFTRGAEGIIVWFDTDPARWPYDWGL